MNLFGYEFRNEKLLEEALTTPSFKMDFPEATDNQRLEFLGDAVLGLLSAEAVFERFKGEQEGSLTVRRTHMVSTAALCTVAERSGLGALLKRNRAAGELPRQSKTLADAVEAVMGAVFLDGGLEAARRVFEAMEIFDIEAAGAYSANAKGELQIRAQAMKPPRHPEYCLVATEGAAHCPVFTVRVSVEGWGEAIGIAGSHKEAEQRAAANLLAAKQ